MSSKRAQRRKACRGKHRYETFDAAYGVAMRKRRATGHVLEAYRCQFCGGYHIGHPVGTTGATGRQRAS